MEIPDIPVRVGLISPGLWHGGAEQWMLSLVQHCDCARIQWTGLAVRYEQHAYGRMHAVLSRHLPIGVGPEAVDAVYARSDVVLLWGVGSVDQRVPSRPRTCRVALVSHGMGHWSARVFEQPDQVDELVGVSPASISPMPPESRWRARVILNCYEEDRIVATEGSREALRQAWGVRDGEHVVGYLGRISPEKNPEALVRMVESRLDVRGVFVGPGATEVLAQVGERLGVADRLVFHGAVEQPGNVLAAFDWLLLPSHEEACSIALLEAWAAGVPAIATPVGVVTEHPDLVRMVATAPTTQQLGAALAHDLADPDGVQARIKRARNVAETEYSAARFGRDWTDFCVKQAGLVGQRAPNLERALFAGLSRSKASKIQQASTCPHRSRRSWHAICRAGVGGIAPHHVVTAEDCIGCLDRGGAPA